MPERLHRVFFALWPDADEAEHLHALGLNLVDHARGGGRAIAARNLHLTLGFCGSVSGATLENLLEGAGQIAADAHEVRLDRLGFWPRGGVVYAAPTRAPSCQRRLRDSLTALMQQAGMKLDHGIWTPHVTLARNVRGVDLPRLGTPLHWHANCFVLAESHLHQSGARYEILESWALNEATEDESV